MAKSSGRRKSPGDRLRPSRDEQQTLYDEWKTQGARGIDETSAPRTYVTRAEREQDAYDNQKYRAAMGDGAIFTSRTQTPMTLAEANRRAGKSGHTIKHLGGGQYSVGPIGFRDVRSTDFYETDDLHAAVRFGVKQDARHKKFEARHELRTSGRLQYLAPRRGVRKAFGDPLLSVRLQKAGGGVRAKSRGAAD
jgi:hypothetical protein